MIAIKKIDNGCFFACLYSFLSDQGSVDLSLQDMHGEAFSAGLCDKTGIINIGQELDVCKFFGVRLREVDYYWPISDTYNDGSLLICTRKINNHCVRFYKQEEPGKIVVMDPDIGGFNYYDKAFLEEREPHFFRLTVNTLNK
jgi:hypothetical protein